METGLMVACAVLGVIAFNLKQENDSLKSKIKRIETELETEKSKSKFSITRPSTVIGTLGALGSFVCGVAIGASAAEATRKDSK